MKKLNKIIILGGLFLSLGLASCDDNGNNQHSDTISKAEKDEHSAENSLDIPGIYVGEFPCEDCPGIILTINLDTAKTYTSNTTYKGNESNEFIVTGKWNIKENTITLTEDSTKKVEKYFAGENFIQQMDPEGNRMYGDKEDEFILRKKANESTAIQ